MQTSKLAVIIPVYNEQGALLANIKAIRERFIEDGLNFSLLLVDDGSADNTWSIIKELVIALKEVSAIRLSRNFGKEAAICAGLEMVRADYYVVMDSDLQHPPEAVKKMLLLIEEEKADIINGVKKSRGKEGTLYRFSASLFYKALKVFSGLDLKNSSDFKLFNDHVAGVLRLFEEKQLFFRGLIAWVGFKSLPYPISVEKRNQGSTRFSRKKLFGLAQNSIIAYSGKPLYLTIMVGMIFFFSAFILAIQTLYNYISGQAVTGFTTVILLILISGSLIMLSLGVIGVYIARIYEEIKQRPRYIVTDMVGSIEGKKKSLKKGS